ncbi:hypothetical protein E2562_008816 [Oryza meyeriana var. granulata]|uniref:Xylanase inhibitor C-terminal domain-containing protein n=1 Tax=Oryza meyeriana var. granulata TaxID=110450 RepID=A0A6G1D041_9ORYZ|nr:hypothetical protein E2562_008816 [Oryza meyeriana var. granulata]
MSVAGSPLAVSPSEYGSLPANVYTALSRAVAAAMAGAPRAPTYSILDTCFQGTAAGMRVLAVDMTFAGGATLRLAPRNVLVNVDDSTTRRSSGTRSSRCSAWSTTSRSPGSASPAAAAAEDPTALVDSS